MIGILLCCIGAGIALYALFNIYVGECSKLEITFIIIGVLLLLFALAQPVIHNEKTYNLIALPTNSTIEGSFFIGSGNIRGINVNTFAYKEGEIIRLKNVEMCEDDEYIYTDRPPKAIVHMCYKRLFSNITRYYCTFYIPAGSVKQQYNIDVSQ